MFYAKTFEKNVAKHFCKCFSVEHMLKIGGGYT